MEMDERVQWKCSGGHIVHKSREICSICGDSQSMLLDNVQDAPGDDSAAHNARGNQADTSILVADLDRSGQQHGRATAVGKWIAASVVAVVVGVVVVAAFPQQDLRFGLNDDGVCTEWEESRWLGVIKSTSERTAVEDQSLCLDASQEAGAAADSSGGDLDGQAPMSGMPAGDLQFTQGQLDQVIRELNRWTDVELGSLCLDFAEFDWVDVYVFYFAGSGFDPDAAFSLLADSC